MRYFYYISKSKVSMLRPQVRGTKAFVKSLKPQIKAPGFSIASEISREDWDRESLVRGVEQITEDMKKNSKLISLSNARAIESEIWYRDTNSWRSGIVAFQGGFSFSDGDGVASYILWRIHRGALLVLVGSPQNILDELVVNEKLLFQGSSGALMEIDSLFSSLLKTDEERAVYLPKNRRRCEGVLWQGEPYIETDNMTTVDERTASQVTIAPYFSCADEGSVKVGALCLDYLSGLPQVSLEVVFRIFSKYKFQKENTPELEEFLRPYEEDLGLWGQGTTRSGLRDQKFVAVYVGSPLYTVIA